MPKMIALVTVMAGKGVEVAPGDGFSVKTEAEAAHLVAIGAAEYAAPAPAAPAPEGDGGGEGA